MQLRAFVFNWLCVYARVILALYSFACFDKSRPVNCFPERRFLVAGIHAPNCIKVDITWRWMMTPLSPYWLISFCSCSVVVDGYHFLRTPNLGLSVSVFRGTKLWKGKVNSRKEPPGKQKVKNGVSEERKEQEH